MTNNMSAMRVLVVGINFHPELTGIGKYTGEAAAYLRQSGHQVRVITAPPYYPQWQVQAGYAWTRYRQEDWNGVKVFRCPLWVPRNPTGFKRLLHLLSFALSSLPILVKQIFWRPDIVLCIAPSLMNAPFAWLAARLSGARAWLHIQDFELDAATQLGILPANRFAVKWVSAAERWLLRRFDQVSSISNRMLARLWQKGVAPEKTVLFPNWVDTNLIYPLSDTREIRSAFHIPEDKIIALYSGNMGHKQGLDILIDAARLTRTSPEIHFVLCGDGATRRDLESAAADLPNVQFLPLQPLEALNNLLNAADIHLLPQRADAADLVMPSKLSGMLASGKAVIATAKPETELAEVVAKLGIITPPEDASALAGAILRLAKDADLRHSLGQRGAAWVKENWSKEKSLHDFCERVEQRGDLRDRKRQL